MSHADDYVLGRSLPHSTRLDAQHLLWIMHLGYVLHPDIPIREDMKIADIGCGTAIWLLDISRSLPRSAQLHGYDISDSLFPSRSLWPENVSLDLLNSMDDPPESLVGQYDVVHLRMWCSNFRIDTKNVNVLIRSVKKMLKPGGYMQWEEADLRRQVVQPEAAREHERELQTVFEESGIDHGCIQTLSASLQREQFAIIREDRNVFQDFTSQLGTKTYLLALKEILEGVKRRWEGDETGQRLAMRGQQSLTKLTSAYSNGLVYNWGPVSILAQLES
ncbi:hypothetical protein CP533_3771 [Ophiocordyceps camponoti-saundersi (nom. inval.)]|nr:hypothetical protein CP533_3771 [Ophiocordyceps camponoti-saundersi (nom. inval.)]